MDKTEELKKDEFGRITCPSCKGKYYWIKGKVCSACLFKEKKTTNKKEYENSLIEQGRKEVIEKIDNWFKDRKEHLNSYDSIGSQKWGELTQEFRSIK